MKLVDVITACGARVCGGTEYMWTCFGENARYIDFADIEGNEYCAIVHDSKTFEVYQVEIHVPGQEQAFKWDNPDYRDAYVQEATARDVAPDHAWDELEYQRVDESTIMQYCKDVGEMYYDDLPVPDEVQ